MPEARVCCKALSRVRAPSGAVSDLQHGTGDAIPCSGSRCLCVHPAWAMCSAHEPHIGDAGLHPQDHDRFSRRTTGRSSCQHGTAHLQHTLHQVCAARNARSIALRASPSLGRASSVVHSSLRKTVRQLRMPRRLTAGSSALESIRPGSSLLGIPPEAG
jgi:hypothetical protein